MRNLINNMDWTRHLDYPWVDAAMDLTDILAANAQHTVQDRINLDKSYLMGGEL